LIDGAAKDGDHMAKRCNHDDGPQFLCPRCDGHVWGDGDICCRCRVDPYPEDTLIRTWTNRTSNAFEVRDRERGQEPVWKDRRGVTYTHADALEFATAIKDESEARLR
jgi:hypothetical protein